MPVKSSDSRRLEKLFRKAALGVALTALVSISGCSSVPDALNPVEWYKDTVNLFTGDDDEIDTTLEQGLPPLQSGLVADRGRPPPGAEQPYPNLGTVPPRPQTSSPQDRQQAIQSLTADAPRQYSSEQLRRQGSASNVLTPVAPQPPAAAYQQPYQPPAPVSPIAPAPQVAAAASQAAAPPPPQLQLQPTSVEQTYRSRLAQRLPTGGFSSLGPANALLPLAGQPFQTVIVSSSGVELGSPAPPADYESSTFFSQGSGPSGRAIRVATILFSNGSAKLGARDKGILRQVYSLHRRNGGKVRIIGHASSRTRNMEPSKHKMLNYKISVNRADSIAKELVRLGVRRNDILIGARSDAEPMYFEVMPSGEAGNRRAEIFLES